MKKIKIIVGAILRGAIIVTPGSAFLWWAWSKVPTLFSILASIGVETLFLFLFAIFSVSAGVAKDLKKNNTDYSAE